MWIRLLTERRRDAPCIVELPGGKTVVHRRGAERPVRVGRRRANVLDAHAAVGGVRGAAADGAPQDVLHEHAVGDEGGHVDHAHGADALVGPHLVRVEDGDAARLVAQGSVVAGPAAVLGAGVPQGKVDGRGEVGRPRAPHAGAGRVVDVGFPRGHEVPYGQPSDVLGQVGCHAGLRQETWGNNPEFVVESGVSAARIIMEASEKESWQFLCLFCCVSRTVSVVTLKNRVYKALAPL